MTIKLNIVIAAMLLVINTSAQDASNSQEFAVAVAKMEFKSKRVILPAPEAASLGQYGNIPMNLFTGTPTVNIPLYELKGNNISASVGLSYNASGFKPEEIATWVGLGWNLNAHGVITRSVLANPDNSSNYFTATNTYASPPNVNDLFANYDYMRNIQLGQMEAQPDIYYYNFNGHTGKFLLKPDQTVIKKDKNDLKITHCISCLPESSSFTIVDEKGVTYQFAAVEVSSTTLDDGVTEVPVSMSYTYASSWYLSSITSADGSEQIIFSYHTTSGEHTMFRDYLQSASLSYNHKLGDTYWTGNSKVSSMAPLVRLKRKYLQSATLYKNGSTVAYVNFESVADQRQDLSDLDFPGERLLQGIKAYSLNSGLTFGLVKQYNFTYGYFPGSRLKLINVQEIRTDAGTPLKPAYSFEYNEGLALPVAGSSIDHWGFSNGGPTTTLIPSLIIAGQTYGEGANRDPNLMYSSAGILTKVKYPTGGYTTFLYELHEAKDPGGNNVTKPVGGVRVKQIIDYSFDNKSSLVKKYEYKLDDGTSSGAAYFPTYVSFSTYQNYATSDRFGNSISPDYFIENLTVSASSIGGLGTLQGGHIGYAQVTEIMTDLSTNVSLGKTLFKYNIIGFSGADDDIANGDLLEKRLFDNGGKLLYEQVNTYTYATLAGISSYKVQASYQQDNKNTLCQYNFSGSIAYAWKTISETNPTCIQSRTYKAKLSYTGFTTAYQNKQLSLLTEKKYDHLSNSYITNTKKFTYGNTLHTLPTSIEQNTSNNEVIITDKKYPLDYTIPGSGTLDEPTRAIQLLQNKNVIGAEIEMVQRRQHADGSNKKYIGGVLTVYDLVLPYPKEVYHLQIASPLTSFNMSTTNGSFIYNADYKLLGAFKYDVYANLVQQMKTLDLSTAYVWDHKNTLPTAEVINAESESIAFSSFETDGTGRWTSVPNIITNRLVGGVTGKYSYNLLAGNNITKSGLQSTRRYLVTYWRKNGSGGITVSSNTGPSVVTTGQVRGSWTYYENLLPLNSNSVTISGAGANIDELRLYPQDARMSTTIFDNYSGLISSRDSSDNKITYYEYDGYYRLLQVRDEDGNIVKNYKYNFGTTLTALTASAQTLFYNVQQQQLYNKQGCPTGTEGTAITYIVPYGRYAATTQAVADSKATADKTNNGQAYANANGQCLYWNTEITKYFSKNDCSYEQGTSQCSTTGTILERSRILYVVPAHTYSSANSLNDANAKAWDDINANGQNYANSQCWCNCSQVGQRFINGVCETGIRYNSSATYMGSGQWQCTYYYTFSDGYVSQLYTEYSSSPCPIY